MGLKKNDRAIYGKRLGTVMSDTGYCDAYQNSYTDVLLDGEEHICQIRKSSLVKVNTYETKNRFEKKNTEFNLSSLYNLDIYLDIKTSIMFNKLEEEVKEVMLGLICNDTENIAEELLDVMQVCMGIAYTQNINLDEHIEKHNQKLLSRGHKFI